MGDGRAYAEARIIVALAGRVAERRARQGSEPGWVRWRTWDEIKAHHEAGHAVAAWALGQSVYRLSIEEGRAAEGDKSQGWGGYALHGSSPSGPVPDVPFKGAESDRRQAAKLCFLLTAERGWKPLLQMVRGLQARAEQIVVGNWRALSWLAIQLNARKQLDQAQIEAVLGRFAPANAGGGPPSAP